MSQNTLRLRLRNPMCDTHMRVLRCPASLRVSPSSPDHCALASLSCARSRRCRPKGRGSAAPYPSGRYSARGPASTSRSQWSTRAHQRCRPAARCATQSSTSCAPHNSRPSRERRHHAAKACEVCVLRRLSMGGEPALLGGKSGKVARLSAYVFPDLRVGSCALTHLPGS